MDDLIDDNGESQKIPRATENHVQDGTDNIEQATTDEWMKDCLHPIPKWTVSFEVINLITIEP